MGELLLFCNGHIHIDLPNGVDVYIVGRHAGRQASLNWAARKTKETLSIVGSEIGRWMDRWIQVVCECEDNVRRLNDESER